MHLGRALGAGGFERLVAIKALHPHIAAEPEFVAMFLDEARLAASIRHPNVVATIAVHEDPLFLVMDYVEGPSLHLVQRELRKRRALMPLEVTLRVLHDTLAGLHAAHELRGADGSALELIHRDVSPHNILLGLDGIARITDFGVARASARLSSTRGGQVKGKIKYMAPEQVASEQLDRRVDVYAAGIVLWEMLTNEHRYQGESDAAVLAQIVMGRPRHPRELVPSIPEAIDAVCMRALAPKRDARFATAADFADALEDAARSSGLSIASGRALSAFVRELDLHESAPATGTAPLDTSSPGSISAKQSLSGSSTSARLALERPDPQHSTSAGTLAATLNGAGSRTKLRRATIVAAVLLLGVGLGVAIYGAGSTGRASATAGSSSAMAARPEAAPSAEATVAAASATGSVAAPEPSASAAPSAAMSASSSVSAGAATAARPSQPAAVRPRSTAFRPGDL